MRTALLAACLAALCCCAVRPALAADSTGTTVAGIYTFVSDISGYLDISMDVCDIAGAVDAGDFSSAETIYTQGQNSYRSTGERRKLQEWAREEAEDQQYWGLYSRHFNDSAWVDTFVMAGLQGQAPFTSAGARGQVVKKGTQSNLLVAYMFHEVDEGAEEIEAGELDPKEGAPHVIDEAAAIYFGGSCPSGTIADVANKRAATFGTKVAGPDGVCTAATNVAAGEALKAMQTAAVNGDKQAYDAAADTLEKQIVIIFMQATLTYADELEDMLAADVAADVSTESAEGVAFFRTIAPLVAQVSEEDAATIAETLAAPSKGVYAKVQGAFKATQQAYGITAAELGTLGGTSACAEAPAGSPSSPSSGAAGRVASAAAALVVAAAGAIAALL